MKCPRCGKNNCIELVIFNMKGYYAIKIVDRKIIWNTIEEGGSLGRTPSSNIDLTCINCDYTLYRKEEISLNSLENLVKNLKEEECRK